MSWLAKVSAKKIARDTWSVVVCGLSLPALIFQTHPLWHQRIGRVAFLNCAKLWTACPYRYGAISLPRIMSVFSQLFPHSRELVAACEISQHELGGRGKVGAAGAAWLDKPETRDRLQGPEPGAGRFRFGEQGASSFLRRRPCGPGWKWLLKRELSVFENGDSHWRALRFQITPTQGRSYSHVRIQATQEVV